MGGDGGLGLFRVVPSSLWPAHESRLSMSTVHRASTGDDWREASALLYSVKPLRPDGWPFLVEL